MPYDDNVHRRSMRLPCWDYREQGAYFVTICTHGRGLLLDAPDVAYWTTKACARSVCGGKAPPTYEFVVMPNHVHGIVWLPGTTVVGARHPRVPPSPVESVAETKPRSDSDCTGASPLRGSGCAPGSIGALVGAFKSSSAKRINRLRGTPRAAVWQRNYYERVIRDERELERAREYILDNPRRWAEDEYFPVPAP